MVSRVQKANGLRDERFPHPVLNGAHPVRRGEPATRTISMIAGQTFENEVLGSLLRQVFQEADIASFETVAEWRTKRGSGSKQEIVLYYLGSSEISDPDTKTALKKFIADAGGRRVIVISRSDDVMAAFDAFDCGAAGFIPPNAGIDELVEAIQCTLDKSVVVSRQSLEAMRRSLATAEQNDIGIRKFFTERQLAVALALQRGAANKTIAYELGLCESTVKVHIRNIMRKLKATNRTQAAFRLNELSNGRNDFDIGEDD